MFLLRTFQLALKSLLLHPLRSFLTVLGILFGVASVIWLLAISEGISQEAQRQIEGLGADNIIVRSIKPPAEVTAAFAGPVPYGLKRDEYEMLVRTIPGSLLKSAIPIRELKRTFSFSGAFGSRDVDGRLVGCTSEYFDVTRLELERGRLLAETDNQGRKNVCVLASGIAQKLFPFEDAIDRRIYLPENKDFYQVVGILKYRSPTAAIGGSLEAQDFDSDVYIPISTLRQQVGDFVFTRRGGSTTADIVEINQITLRIDSVKHVREIAELVRDALGVPPPTKNMGAPAPGAEKAPPGKEVPAKDAAAKAESSAFARAPRRDVGVTVPEELLEQARVTRIMFMAFMGVIAAISLLVGGIGIMNIMLATVTERTREIGIRRALGATRSHIIMQFLVETITLSVVGGVVGIGLGVFGVFAMIWIRDLLYLNAAGLMANLPDVARKVTPQIVWVSIPISFGISVAVGVIFGTYPAIRAAKMDPIEALRHE